MNPKLTLLLFLLPYSSHAAGSGVHLKADVLFTLGSLPITNSIVTSWVVSLFLIFLVRYIVGKPQMIPTKGQLVAESVIGGIRSIIEPIVGKKVFFASFGLLSGLFFFILIHNWSGLLPGVGTVGYGSIVDDHFIVKKPLVRPANADLNMTLALALVANISWLYLILKYAGVKVIMKDLFGNKAQKGDVPTIMFLFLGVIFIAVGFIEILSILFRPVSLTFRLFGNVFGGESLLHSMLHLVPQINWILPVPFYFMEVLIGLVQALVFMLLVSVYIGLICNHDEGEHH
ncbi:MAG: F0F1 ATP synthase subunit A [Verrucomicrobiota bacterium]|nr:F0F1 ATP synthase subunit A [Verrucomicrobiota bacterium]